MHPHVRQKIIIFHTLSNKDDDMEDNTMNNTTWTKKNNNVTTLQDYFLNNLGKKSLAEVNDIFKKSYADGYKVEQLDETVAYLRSLPKTTPIVICGDFDVDGITSVVINLLGLQWFGFKDVSYMIPRRFTEGFGLNIRMVDDAASAYAGSKETPVLLTCDNGTSSYDAIRKAKEYGMTVIIIDHHEPDRDEDNNIITPPADFIVNPHVNINPDNFDGYCGAGLSFKVMSKLLNDKNLKRRLQVFAAIGTVCDMMEMKEENYVIVKNGLKLLPYSNVSTKGLYALLEECNMTHVANGTGIGFDLGPRLNSISRLNDEGAKVAVGFLLEDEDRETATLNAQALTLMNNDRKDMVKEGMLQVEEYLKDKELPNAPLLFYFPEMSEGIIGIVAGNIAEKYGLPTIVFSNTKEPGCMKGSARSIPGYNLIKHLHKHKELFVKLGGHKGAAGMTILKTNFNALKNKMQEDYVEPYVKGNMFDVEIFAKDIPDTIEQLKAYEPFANGNPMPTFKVTNFKTVDRYHEDVYVHLIGSEKQTVKLYEKATTAIGFRMADRFEGIGGPVILNLYGRLNENYYKDSVTKQIMFDDFELVE